MTLKESTTWTDEQVESLMERISAMTGSTNSKRAPSKDTTVDKVFTDAPEAPKGRGRGRPPGSKNVKHAISTQVPKRVRVALDRLCEENGTNTSKMVCRILTVAMETPDLWVD